MNRLKRMLFEAIEHVQDDFNADGVEYRTDEAHIEPLPILYAEESQSGATYGTYAPIPEFMQDEDMDYGELLSRHLHGLGHAAQAYPDDPVACMVLVEGFAIQGKANDAVSPETMIDIIENSGTNPIEIAQHHNIIHAIIQDREGNVEWTFAQIVKGEDGTARMEGPMTLGAIIGSEDVEARPGGGTLHELTGIFWEGYHCDNV